MTRAVGRPANIGGGKGFNNFCGACDLRFSWGEGFVDDRNLIGVNTQFALKTKVANLVG
jgi:hypothetical protein